MAKDYSNKVRALKSRRQSKTKRKGFEKQAALGYSTIDSESPSYIDESYQKRTKSSALTYALGAMDEVNSTYTRVSHEEAERVTTSLASGLLNKFISTDIRLQGSLPLNVHIRRASDVDLLVLPTDFLIYDVTGPKASTYYSSPKNKVTVITELRSSCYDVLKSKYFAATIDNSKAKCITLSGGSLSRDVDVVPALWFDSYNYQVSSQEKDRGVEIYDKNKAEFKANYPFLVRALVNEKDARTNGGCKKAIRLLKTLKVDSDIDVDLSSFDIMSLVYSMEDRDLFIYPYSEGILLLNLKKYLDTLVNNSPYLKTLDTIDRTRKIVQSNNNEKGIQTLRDELNDLIDKLIEELSPYTLYKTESIAKDLLEKSYPVF